jgi:hypothetical protein
MPTPLIFSSVLAEPLNGSVMDAKGIVAFRLEAGAMTAA